MPDFLSQASRSRWVFLCLITVGAAVLRVVGWDTSLWIDEIATVERYARLPLSEIVSRYGTGEGANHVLHTLLVHVSIGLFGEEEWAVRLPAVLFGVATVPAFYRLASELWSARSAALGTVILAASYPHVYYSQTARGYSAFLLFAVVASLFAVRAVRGDGGWRGGVAYALVIALGTWAMPLMVFVAAGHALVLGLHGPRGFLRWVGLGSALAALLYVPMASEFLAYHADPSGTGHGLFSGAFWEEMRPALVPLAISLPPALLLGARLLRRQPVVTAALVAPAVLTVGIFLIRGQGVHPRSFIYGLLLAHVLAAEAFDWLQARRRWLAAGSAVILSLAMGLHALRHASTPRQPFRQAARELAAMAAPGQPLVGISLAGQGLRYYEERVLVARTIGEARASLSNSARGWVAVTLEDELRSYAPDLHAWVFEETSPCRTLEGRMYGGSVQLRRWSARPDAAERPDACAAEGAAAGPPGSGDG